MRSIEPEISVNRATCRAAIVGAVVAIATLLSACGGGGPDGDPGTGAPPDGVGGGQEPPDPSGVGFVENLLEKVEDGEWTEGEGLIATLKLFAGEQSADGVLRQPELDYHEGTGILAMARDYVADGPDADAKDEIRRLLDLLVLSNDRLEAMAGIRELTASGTVALRDVQQAQSDCLAFFAGYQLPPGVGRCLEVGISDLLDDFYTDQYRVFFPAASMPQAGWTGHHVQLTISALEASVPVLKELGELPPVNIVLSVVDHPAAAAQAWPWQTHLINGSPPSPMFVPCNVVLYTSMQGETDGDFEQTVAHELGHCWEGATFPAHYEVKYDAKKWWDEGVAEYLSNVVYPENNAEWGVPPERRSRLNGLAFFELSTTLLERAYTNWIFFQYLQNRIGNEGIIDLIMTLPTDGGTADQEARLAAFSNMDELYHDFVKALTDGEVRDASGLKVPYPISELNRPTTTITGQNSIMEDLAPFSVSRFQLAVVPDRKTTLSLSKQGPALESARPSSGGDWAAVPTELPEEGLCHRDIIVAVTSTGTGGFELNASNPQNLDGATCDPCLDGEWVVSNNDYAEMLSADPLYDYTVSGSLALVFKDDGSVEWRFSQFTQTSVGEPDGPEPGRVSSTISNGGGIQSWTTRFGGLLVFSGPEVHITFTQTGSDLVLENFLDTGFGDLQTGFAYECEGDLLTIVRITPHAGPFELGWTRVR